MAKVKFTYRMPRGLISPDSRPPDADRAVDIPIVPQAPAKPPAAARSDEPADEVDAERLVDRWWHESSFDLRCGLDVVEDTTVPGELMDDLFGQYKAPRNNR